MHMGLSLGINRASSGSSVATPPTVVSAPKFIGLAVPGSEISDAFPGLANEVAGYVAAGIKLVRFDFRYSDLSGGSYTTQDATVAALVGAGIEIVGIINADGAVAGLNSGAERTLYATYCTNVATHYAASVTKWESTNEPNLAGSTAVLMADYAPALVLAYAALKAVNSSIEVIAGALASIETTTGGHQSAEAFVQYLYDNCPDAFDSLSYHSYTDSSTIGWTSSLGASWHTRTILLAIIAVMVAEGDTTRRIHITETGMPTIGSGLTELNQMNWLKDSIAELYGMDRIASYYWYSYINRQAEAVGQDGYGIVNKSSVPKLMKHELVRLTTLDNDTTPTFEHTKGGGNTTHALFRRFLSPGDPLANNLTFSLVGAPAGVAISSSTGIVTVTDASVSAQLATAITVRATHSNGTSVDFAITLTVWAPNLITNPTFAGAVTSWALTGSATIAYDTDQGNCLVTVNGAGGGVQDSQTITCTSGVSHTYRAKIKTGTFVGSLNFGYEASDVVIGPLTNDYVWYSRTVTTSDTDAALNIRRSTAVTGTFYVDEVYFGLAV
jgi:hypothetical protein